MKQTKVYITIAAFSILVGLSGLITLLRSPYMGITFESSDKKWLIASIDHKGPAVNLEPFIGAEVVSISDFDLKKYDLVPDNDIIPDADSFRHFWQAQRFFSEQIVQGRPVVINLVAGQQIHSEQITPSSYPVSRALAGIGAYYGVAIVCLVLGLTVVGKKPDDPLARIFFFLNIAVSLVLFPYGSFMARCVSIDFSASVLMQRIIGAAAFAMTPALFLYFCLIFPREKKIVQNRLFLVLLWGLPAVITALYQTRTLYASFHMLFVIMLLGGIAAMVHSYIKLQSPMERAQAKWVLWATGIFACVFLAVNTLPILFDRLNYYSDLISTITFLIIPVSMTFAIMKHRLMDIDTLFDNAFIYGITLMILVLLDLAVVESLANVQTSAFSIPGPLPAVAAVWLVVFAYTPVRNSVKRIVKKLLKRELYDLNETAMKLSGLLLGAVDVLSVLRAVNGVLSDALHPMGGEVILLRPPQIFLLTSDAVRKAHDSELSVPVGIHLRTTSPLYSIADPSTLTKEYSGGVFIPLIGSTGRLGCIVLKNKHSGRLYNEDDMKLLSVAANQAALAIDNIMSREMAAQREREAQEEKRRISQDIHDGIGSSLTNAIMLTELLREDKAGDEEEYRKRMASLKSLLNESMTELRSIIAIESEEGNTVGDLMASVKREAERINMLNTVRVEVRAEVERSETSISPRHMRNVSKIIHEALANIIKHSAATEACVVVQERGGLIKVSIIDNGNGFDVSRACAQGCHGLRNIDKRCQEMEAKLTVRTEMGKGTNITVHFDSSPQQPLHHER